LLGARPLAATCPARSKVVQSHPSSVQRIRYPKVASFWALMLKLQANPSRFNGLWLDFVPACGTSSFRR